MNCTGIKYLHTYNLHYIHIIPVSRITLLLFFNRGTRGEGVREHDDATVFKYYNIRAAPL